MLVAGLVELLAGELLERVTELLVFVLGFVVLVTEELGLRVVTFRLFTDVLVLVLLGAVCTVLGLVETACLELVTGLELLAVVAVLPLLEVAGLLETELLL